MVRGMAKKKAKKILREQARGLEFFFFFSSVIFFFFPLKMKTICILLPRDPATHDRTREQLRLYTEALHGFRVVTCLWDQFNPEGIDAVSPLLAWGYHDDTAAWNALLNTLEKSVRTSVGTV